MNMASQAIQTGSIRSALVIGAETLASAWSIGRTVIPASSSGMALERLCYRLIRNPAASMLH